MPGAGSASITGWAGMADYPGAKEPDMATTMTKPPTTKLLTATDLLRLAGEGVRGELIRGVLHEALMVQAWSMAGSS